jgi:hypothetical protein
MTHGEQFFLASQGSIKSFLPPIQGQSPLLYPGRIGAGSQDDESTGENTNSAGQLPNNELIQVSLIQMLQKKCAEMAKLADREVEHRGQAESVAQLASQTVHQVNQENFKLKIDQEKIVNQTLEIR